MKALLQNNTHGYPALRGIAQGVQRSIYATGINCRFKPSRLTPVTSSRWWPFAFWETT